MIGKIAALILLCLFVAGMLTTGQPRPCVICRLLCRTGFHKYGKYRMQWVAPDLDIAVCHCLRCGSPHYDDPNQIHISRFEEFPTYPLAR